MNGPLDFDLYLYSAYAAHYVWYTRIVAFVLSSESYVYESMVRASHWRSAGYIQVDSCLGNQTQFLHEFALKPITIK